MTRLSFFPTTGFSPVVGIQKPLAIPAPIAGADLSVTLPGGSWWRLISLMATLTTSAAVANRSPRFQITDGTTPFYQANMQGVIAASLSRDFCVSTAFASEPPALAGVTAAIPFPNCFLPAGYVLRFNTLLIDVADQWSAGFALLEEVDLGPYGEAVGMLNTTPGDSGGGG